jgi:Domain of unknown function (DUF222)/HNH endonuclease
MCSDRAVPLELLEREITALASQIHAATCRWLALVAEYDRREGWAHWGCKSCAHWVSHQCGIALGPAREHVRVARRLDELPLIRGAFAEGELSYSKVRALTRVENVEREQDLLDLARHATASQLERLLRAYRGVVAAERAAAGGGPERWVRVDHDDDGALLLQARLPADEGALVLAALDAARDQLAAANVPAGTSSRGAGHDPDVPAGTPSSPPMAHADALLALADAYVAGQRGERTGGDRYQVVVHVDTATLSGGEEAGRCELDHGPPVAVPVARRLACDASVVRLLERDGTPLDVGRKTRSIPAPLRRALAARDGGCRFPGCSSRRFVDAHHIDHWADGGPTELGNLVLLCRHHHRLLHEGGYTATRGRDGGLVFRRPDGRAIPACPESRRGRAEPLRATRRPDACVPRSSDPLHLVDGVDAMLAFAPIASGEPPGV